MVMCWLGWALGGHELAANQSTIRAPARAEGEGGAGQVAAKLSGINIIQNI